MAGIHVLSLETDQIVMFVDIQNFGDFVWKEFPNKGVVDEKRKTERKIITNWDGIQNWFFADNSQAHQNNLGYKFRFISDSFVFAVSPGNLHVVLDSLWTIARVLVQEGLLLRGGIAFGDQHFEQNIIGAPYMGAYAVESKIANFFRFLMRRDHYRQCEPNIRDDIKRFFVDIDDHGIMYTPKGAIARQHGFPDMLQYPEDFVEFDFYRYLLSDLPSPASLDRPQRLHWLKEYLNIIEEELKQQLEQKVVDKYEWLRRRLFSIITENDMESDFSQ